jgi:hypothetical protein
MWKKAAVTKLSYHHGTSTEGTEENQENLN